MREAIYNALTNLAYSAAIALGNRLSGFVGWLNERADGVEQTRLDIVNGVNSMMQGAPWPFSEALIWFWSLVNNFMVTPIMTGVRYAFIYASQLVVSLYNYGDMMYVPERWLLNIILFVRDRILNVFDAIDGAVGQVVDWANGWFSWVQQALTNLSNSVISWFQGLQGWINTNIVSPLQGLISGFQNLVTVVTQMTQALNSILTNPAYWIWQNVVPYLAHFVTEWLKSEWYAGRK